MAAADVSRINVLSRSKTLPADFLDDRRSVYWIERWPQSSEGGVTAFAVTPRVDQLAQPKSSHMQYNGDRPTPIWQVSDGAKNAEATPRLQELASARPVHDNYLYHRSVYTEVPDSAKNSEPSHRLSMLSEPKPHKVWANSSDTLPEGEFHEPIYRVRLPAITSARCTARLEVLAEAKENHELYKPEKQVQWPVTNNAMNAEASTRLQQLARPKSGRLVRDDYDPYKVTVGARLARPSPRVTELSEPIPRKQRQKKGV